MAHDMCHNAIARCDYNAFVRGLVVILSLAIAPDTLCGYERIEVGSARDWFQVGLGFVTIAWQCARGGVRD